jgi:L-aspartate oxidase
MKNHDVLIIGTGVAGLVSAIRLAECGAKVGIYTKELDPNVTNTNLAQGGIIYSDDNLLVDDIFNASSKTSYRKSAEVLMEKSKKLVDTYLLEKAKTNFESDNSVLKLTKEAAHSISRIIFKGDHTGREIQISLMNYSKQNPNITFYTEHIAIDLITLNHHGLGKNDKYEKNKVLGAFFLHKNDVVKVVANFTVLATGGVGNLYLNTTNSTASRGDGHAMAKRAGCQLMDMEFIQFHPTTLFLKNYNKQLKLNEKQFLLTEAIRGEGGILLNQNGERFMINYDPNQELASRDIVSQSITKEIIKTKSECVYLDISHKDSEWIKKRFPDIYSYCLSVGLDITTTAIPVVPAAHYTCGGVKTDLTGKTNLDRLYAVGEVACTGLHGANRLASTSLLEGLTYAHLASNDILWVGFINEDPSNIVIKDWVYSTEQVENDYIEQDLFEIKSTMWNYVGIIRTQKNLKRAKLILQQLKDDIENFYKKAKLTNELIGLRNSVEIGLLIVDQSLQNNNPVGCFYKLLGD